MIDYICTKCHENILNSIRVIEQTRKVNRQIERTDGRHGIIQPVLQGQVIKNRSSLSSSSGINSQLPQPLLQRTKVTKKLSIVLSYFKKHAELVAEMSDF